MHAETNPPHLLLVGGFLTEPANYRRVRTRLMERGAADVSIAPVHVPDWLAAGIFGFDALVAKTRRAIRAAHQSADGHPIIVVAHSGGGILARLAMVDTESGGCRQDVADRIGCLVTLGTPHDLANAAVRFRHRGIEAARSLARRTPGAWFAPGTAYLTVGSDLVRPGSVGEGSPWDRLRGRAFRSIVGPITDRGGDGIVSLDAVHLAGARQLTFSDVRHGVIGGPWYGDAEIVDRWWPIALDLWRGAIAARGADRDESLMDAVLGE